MILLVVCGGLIASRWLGIQASLNAVVLCCFLGIVGIGLPHGGLDHRVGRQVLQSWGWPDSIVLFATVYLLVSLIVLLGWYLSPFVTVLIFFFISAWHFGLEEDGAAITSLRQQLGRFARGGMVIWVTCLWQPERVGQLLQVTMPTSQGGAAEWAVTICGWLGLLGCLLVADDCLDRRNDQIEAAELAGERIGSGLRIARVILFGVLFATIDPLLSFTVYFCGWHSIRGLRQLYREYGRSLGSFLWELMPMTSAAIALFVGGSLIWWTELGWQDSFVRVSFLGLSAVAIPHLLLHVLAHGIRSAHELEPSYQLAGGPR
jgi:Brp/Blh family beta-carotene 15,15'-monooxygenase